MRNCKEQFEIMGFMRSMIRLRVHEGPVDGYPLRQNHKRAARLKSLTLKRRSLLLFRSLFTHSWGAGNGQCHCSAGWPR
jgi:hypothetical protein